MKKQNLKALSLNKKSISSLEAIQLELINGGSTAAPCTDFTETNYFTCALGPCNDDRPGTTSQYQWCPSVCGYTCINM